MDNQDSEATINIKELVTTIHTQNIPSCRTKHFFVKSSPQLLSQTSLIFKTNQSLWHKMEYSNQHVSDSKNKQLSNENSHKLLDFSVETSFKNKTPVITEKN